jgi:hypothetical protein
MNTRHFACIAAALVLGACDSPLDVDPTASIDSGTALSTPRGIELGVNGAYRQLQDGDLYGLEEMVFPDLYADNLDFTGTFQTHREVSLRAIPTSNGAVLLHWEEAYEGINRVNNLLAAIDVVALTPAERDQYRGESLFIRGLLYHMMVKYFGDVPLILTPSSGVTDASLVARTPAAQVYTQIETDLEEAATLLPSARNNGRATQGAANALLARVYLDQGKNAQARDKATLLINATTLYSLNANFRSNWTTKNSPESIFELQYSINNSNSQAFWFYPQALGGRWGFAPSLGLVNSFEATDARRAASIQTSGTSRYGFKYHRIANGDDNVVVLRLAEMYLIRAEANARLAAADATVRADLDVVRARAGLAPLAVTVAGQAALLAAVLQERRVELAFEGHRFFDLRRHGVATTVLSISADRLLWPIPQAERDVNINLAQNPGY